MEAGGSPLRQGDDQGTDHVAFAAASRPVCSRMQPCADVHASPSSVGLPPHCRQVVERMVRLLGSDAEARAEYDAM